MPVIKELSNKYGFKVIIPVIDHEPKHVHIYKGKEESAKIEIETGKVIYSFMKTSETAKAKKLIEENKALLIQKWNTLMGE